MAIIDVAASLAGGAALGESNAVSVYLTRALSANLYASAQVSAPSRVLPPPIQPGIGAPGVFVVPDGYDLMTQGHVVTLLSTHCPVGLGDTLHDAFDHEWRVESINTSDDVTTLRLAPVDTDLSVRPRGLLVI